MRQSDRVDAVTGKGRSRGHGFVEMHVHADALRVLRWANNNPDVGALSDTRWKEELADFAKKEKAKESRDEARIKWIKDEMEGPSKPTKETLIVEFSIKNIQVVRRRAMQREKRVRRRPFQFREALWLICACFKTRTQHVRKPAPGGTESHRPRNAGCQLTKVNLPRRCGSRSL